MSDNAKKFPGKSLIWKVIPIAAAGIVLLVVGNMLLGSQSGTNKKENTQKDTAAEELDTYRATLETEIAALCASVSGVGSATVAVTLSGGFLYEYATDSQSGSGGSLSEKYVTVGSGSAETPIYLSVRPPGVAGIAVVCAGGANAGVRRELTSLLAAAYGVPTNRIWISPSK